MFKLPEYFNKRPPLRQGKYGLVIKVVLYQRFDQTSSMLYNRKPSSSNERNICCKKIQKQ